MRSITAIVCFVYTTLSSAQAVCLTGSGEESYRTSANQQDDGICTVYITGAVDLSKQTSLLLKKQQAWLPIYESLKAYSRLISKD